MSVTNPAPWHKDSYDSFVQKRLPELIASRLPLENYAVESTGTHACRIDVTLSSAAGGVSVRIDDIPQPDADGVFDIEGKPVVVIPVALSEKLDQTEVLCVGEQLYEFIEPRLGEAPADLKWNEDVLNSWLPIGQWARDFLCPAPLVMGTVPKTTQELETRNWLSRCEHLRRITIPGRPPVVSTGQRGIACPIMTPEGPNIGRILSVARGAEIRDGKCVVIDDRPEMGVSIAVASIPCLEHSDPNRALMGSNMMRQWVVPETPEPALVQTGNEPDAPGFWCGRNVLTAFASWGPGTFEDGIVISESCAKRFSIKGPSEPGDKLSNRHGAKGVIAEILPDDQMPHLADGTPVELVYNFVALHTRCNYGQVREAVLGRLAHAEGQMVMAPPFESPSDADIRSRLAKAGLPETGMEVLRDGKDGPALARPSTVGWVYWGLTHHLAAMKLKLPPKFVGQRQDISDFHTLRSLSAFEAIYEHFNTRSENREDSASLPGRLEAGTVAQAGAPTPGFNDLQQRLAAAGIRATLDKEELHTELAAPKDERLRLAVPVPNPWLGGQELAEVGLLSHVKGHRAVRSANEQMARVLKSKAPENLVARAKGNLAHAVEAYLESLVGPQHVRPNNRVRFSGRAVATPGIDLRLDQIGIPEEAAWAFFGPMVARELGDKSAVESRNTEACKALDDIMGRSWVIVHRRPNLSPTVFVAFRPVRRAERVVRLHPLACPLLSADFDGDQVAVYLPVTEAGQKEACEKLSIAAHLKRDPKLISQLCPQDEVLCGLAARSLTNGGRKEIGSLLGSKKPIADELLGRERLVSLLESRLEQAGEEKVLEALDELMRVGFREAKASGASMSPFLDGVLSDVAVPKSPSEETWPDCLEELTDRLASLVDYQSSVLGPQLLAVHSGARGQLRQLVALLMCQTCRDVDGQWVFSPKGFVSGLDADTYFARTATGRLGLAEVAFGWPKMEEEARESHQSKSLKLLARAMRSRKPGAVFARAAANGESDPLTDLDSRLFVGLKA